MLKSQHCKTVPGGKELMSEIKNREDKPVPGIDYSEIYIYDENDLGTGEFITVVEPGSMRKINPLISNVLNEPHFLLIVSINLAIDSVTALLGKSYKEPASSRHVYTIPEDIHLEEPHEFTVYFKDWEVKGMKLDGNDLVMEE